MYKKVIIFLFLFLSFNLNAQDRTDSSLFSNEDIKRISNVMDSLIFETQKDSTLIAEFERKIAKQEYHMKLDSMEIGFLNKNIELYIEREELLKPKWYNNRYLWYFLGVLSTIGTGHVVSQAWR